MQDKRPTRIFFALLIAVFVAAFITFRVKGKSGKEWEWVISSDSKGYYAYLPAVFIKHNLHNQQYDDFYTHRNADGTLVNKYYIGTALMEAPFFFVACAHAYLAGYPVDGYSFPFAFWIGFAPVFYTLLGLYFLFGLLLRMGISRYCAFFVVVLAGIGTNLLYYTVYKGNFSHAFSFACIVLFYLQVLHISMHGLSRRRALYLGLLLSFILVLRPVNLLAVLWVPFFFTSWQHFRQQMVKPFLAPRILSFAILAMFPVILLQCWAWYVQTGHFLVWSYNQEGFYFSNPRPLQQLFSFNGGLFVYNPVLLTGTFGFVALYRIDRYKFYCTLFFLAVLIYITSSWWTTNYGYTFSLRPYVDYTVVFMVLAAYLLSAWKKARTLIVTVFILASGLNLLYSYQAYRDILPFEGMNATKFAQVFGKTSDKYVACFGGTFNQLPYAPRGIKAIYKFDAFAQGRDTLWVNQNEFPGGTSFEYPDSLHHVRHVHFTINFGYYIPPESSLNGLCLVFDIVNRGGERVKYYTVPLKEFKYEDKQTWRRVTYMADFPNVFSGGDKVGVYIWNAGKERFGMEAFDIVVRVPNW